MYQQIQFQIQFSNIVEQKVIINFQNKGITAKNIVIFDEQSWY